MMHKDKFEEEKGLSFKSLFVPLTNLKAIHWIVVIGFLVYGNTVFNGFVGDDFGQIVNNPTVQSVANIPTFFAGGTFYNGSVSTLTGTYYRPILSSIYAVLYALFGLNPFAYHFFQILIHIANAVLIFQILRFFIKKNISFFAALIFLIHPIQSEAVDYIANLQEVLFFFFGSLAFYLELKLPQSLNKIITIVTLLIFSVLTKETGVLFILLILVYKFVLAKKTDFKNSLLLYSCLGVLYIPLRLLFTHGFTLVTPHTQLSEIDPFTRLLDIPLIISYYFQKFIFPLHLVINQSWIVTTRPVYDFYIASFEVIICFSIIVWIGRKLYTAYKEYFNLYLFFLIWLGLGFLFHLQIFSVLDFTVSDRWFYFPIAGLLGILSLLVQLFLKTQEKYSKIVFVLIGILLIVLSLRTTIRNTNFYDQYSLLSHDVQYSNDSSMQSALALELMKRNEFNKAYYYLQDAIKINPKGYLNWNDLGVYYENTGQITKAEDAFKTSIKNAPYYLAYENLAGHMLVYDDPKKAEDYLKDTLQKLPTDGHLWFIYSLVENKLGKKNEALEAARIATVYFPINDTYLLYNMLSRNVPVSFKVQQSPSGEIIYICSLSECN